MMKLGSLYVIWNDINDKLYVGITMGKVSRRFHEHIYSALANKDNYRLHRAMRKHGLENFHIDCLLSDIPANRLSVFEVECIKYFDSYRKGYNGDPGGRGVGREVSKETRNKISKIHKGKIPWNKGVPMSIELKEKLLKTHLGKKHSEETRKKLSLARKGRKPMLGKHHSEETRKKISEGQIRRFSNKEERQRMSRVLLENPNHAKKVIQLTKDNKFVKEWVSVRRICSEMNVSIYLLRKCLRGIRSEYCGYVWRYKEEIS